MAAAKLTQSSRATRSWVRGLRDRLPELKYGESRYWATFRSQASRGVVAYLNPSQKGVRLFLALDPASGPDLQPTPSSSGWARRYPSVFQIGGERDLPRAAQLIGMSQTSIADRRGPVSNRTGQRPAHMPPEELVSTTEYFEGATRSVLVNAFERNRRGREKCLQHFGTNCIICGFSFRARYGELAAGYIQVHHLVPLANVRKSYRLNPRNDLRPVCPNCHAVIHRREPALSIEEVKAMLRPHDSSIG